MSYKNSPIIQTRETFQSRTFLFFPFVTSVPAQRILGHNGRADLLPSRAPTPPAASTVPAVSIAVHRTCTSQPVASGTRHERRAREIVVAARHDRRREQAGRALVRESPLLVPARDEEHGGSVGGSAADDSDADTSCRGTDGHVVTQTTTDWRAWLVVA